MTLPAITDDAKRWACPFCPLHCCDVEWDSLVSQCELAASAWKTLDHPSHRIGADLASIDEVTRWSQGQSFGDCPLIQVSGPTLTQSRWLIDAMDSGELLVQVEATESVAAIAAAVVRDGVISATLGEVHRRADAVWMLGDFSSLPRIETWIAESAERIATPTLSSLEAMSLSTNACRIPIPESSNYFVVLVGRDALSGSHADQTVAAESLVRWVSSLNEGGGRRAALVTVSHSVSFENVARWRTNTSGSSKPSREVANSGCPTIRLGTPLADSEPVTVQIGGIDLGPSKAEVYLATEIAGVDRSDIVVRGDGSVTLPLDRLAQFADARVGLQTPQTALELLLHR